MKSTPPPNSTTIKKNCPLIIEEITFSISGNSRESPIYTLKLSNKTEIDIIFTDMDKYNYKIGQCYYDKATHNKLYKLLNSCGVEESIKKTIQVYKNVNKFSDFLKSHGKGIINPHSIQSLLFNINGTKKFKGGITEKKIANLISANVNDSKEIKSIENINVTHGTDRYTTKKYTFNNKTNTLHSSILEGKKIGNFITEQKKLSLPIIRFNTNKGKKYAIVEHQRREYKVPI